MAEITLINPLKMAYNDLLACFFPDVEPGI